MNFNFYQIPLERTYLRLDDEFRHHIFNKAKLGKGSYKALARTLKCGLTSITYWKNGRHAIPTLVIKDLVSIINEDDFNLDLVQTHLTFLASGKMFKNHGSIGRGITCKFPLTLSPRLARVVSHIMGDGSININHYFSVTYFNNCLELIESVRDDVSVIFGRVPLNIGRGKDNVYYLNIPSIVGMILYHWFGDFSSEKIVVPEVILASDLETQSQFLRGIFDDEGTIDTRFKSIRFGSKSKNLSFNVCLLLKNFGICPTKIYKLRYITKVNKLKGYIYNFGITNREGLLIFNEKIGFSHPKKKLLLSEIANSKVFKPPFLPSIPYNVQGGG